MAKVVFGEYAAFVTQGGVRFQKDKKLIGEKSVPPEVVAYLYKRLGVEPKAPKFAPPTEAEKAKLRAESLETPPELERTPEEMEAARNIPVEVPQEPAPVVDPLTEDDFDTPDEPLEPTPAEAPLPSEELPNKDAQVVDSTFLESVSIHTAPLEDIAEALYNRFGLYSVYLGRLPAADEVNPLTGETFTKYHLGIAYQAAIRAQNSGILNRSPEVARAKLDEGRAASANMQVDPVARTMGDARRENSFAFRTSVRASDTNPRTEVVHEKGADGLMHAVQREIPAGETGISNGANAKYDKEEEEMLVEPNFSSKKVIRPDW
jgi:hypothetical protein